MSRRKITEALIKNGLPETENQERQAISADRENLLALTVEGIADRHAFMAFSLRNGGTSSGPFRSLNFSASHGDAEECVNNNFHILGQALGFDPSRIVSPRQVHGVRIAVVNEFPAAGIVADAIVTASPHLFPAIKTADCLPILFFDPCRRVAAAVHAGWRGTVQRITAKVVRFLKEYFLCQPRDMRVALGPAIGPCCYEVDNAVLVPFFRTVPYAERFVHKITFPGKPNPSFRLDLTGANRQELLLEGIPRENITEFGLCTHCREDILFSYRRDGVKSGRHIAVVGFTE